MSPCLTVVQEQIRAEIYLGTQLLARTPFVKSFNVQKSRNQTSTTFNVLLEIQVNTSFMLGQRLSIHAGLRGQLKQIFTGKIETISPRPVFGKPSYYSVLLEGRGILSELENKTFSRRLKSDGQGLFCMITGGAENRPEAFYSLDKEVRAGNQMIISSSPNPAGLGENSPLVVHRSYADGVGAGGGGILASIAGKPSGGGTGGSGFRQHTHENMDEGGPAYAVFSSD